MVSILRIDREGAWYADDNQIIRREIVQLFAQHLERDDNGGFMVCLGQDRMLVKVDNVPFVVTGIIPGDGTISVRLADGRELELPEEPVELVGDVPYVSLRWPRDTRIARQAWWQLTDYLEENCGQMRLCYKLKTWPIERLA
ncbi:MAG TPA: hypothetical protein DCM26_00150 [Desulfotomaculum sp.]|jgi:hypothetical protein|nr:hypothetical protein [Desulfotomaculum sp.]